MVWNPCFQHFFLIQRYPISLVAAYPGGGGRKFRVRDHHRLAALADMYNGVADLLYQAWPGGFVDKVRFDIDGPRGEASSEALELAGVLARDGFPVILVYSGCRGYHVYALVEPFTAEPSTVQLVLRGFVGYYVDSLGLRLVDVDASTSAGDPHYRLPNTVNMKCGRYSHFLPLNAAGYAGKPTCPPNPTLERRPPDIREYALGAREAERYALPPPDLGEAPRAPGVSEFLRRLLRPCIWYYATHDPEPPHFIRTHMVLELCWLGFGEEEIIDIIERLGWRDYRRRVTEYHVRRLCYKVRSQGLRPASCQTIRARGYCLGPEACEWWPGYWGWWGHLSL